MPSRRAARIALAVLLSGIYGTLSIARKITEHIRALGSLRLMVAIAFVLAAAGGLFAVFRDARNRSVRVAGALTLVALVYAAVVFPMNSPEEKLHFIEYGLVGLLAWAGAPERFDGWRRTAFAAAFSLAAGWLDEGIQALLPNRYYDLRDVAFNFTAGMLAVCALELIRWARPGSFDLTPRAPSR